MIKCKHCKSYSLSCRSYYYVVKPDVYNKFTGQKTGWAEYLSKSNNKNGDCEYFKYKWYVYLAKAIYLYFAQYLTKRN